MNSFYLKIIACITMFLDHYARLFEPIIYPLTYIGRFAFPIFAFQASIGFERTKNFKKYLLRLLLFAIISQIPFYLYFGQGINVIFTILFGILSIYFYKLLTLKKLHILGFSSTILIAYLAEILKFDYGFYGVILIFVFYITRNSKILMTTSFAFLTIAFFVHKLHTHFNIVYIYHLIYTLLAIIPILFYNKKEGRKTKFFLYIFYPLHIILLYLIKTFIV